MKQYHGEDCGCKGCQHASAYEAGMVVGIVFVVIFVFASWMGWIK